MSNESAAMEMSPLADRFEVHPVAALFPMMADDELDDLAADIKANGLIHPLVLSADGSMLVDGRNRFEACTRAMVDPSFTKLEDGQDPISYILGQNIARRHLSKPQQAILVAQTLDKHQDFGVKAAAARSFGLPAEYLSKALAILSYVPERAHDVLTGVVSLAIAYEEALARKDELQDEEEAEQAAAAERDAHLAQLQEHAPDLGEAVISDRMALTEALTRYEQRVKDEADLAILRTSAPDLADEVADGATKLPEAMAVYRQREQAERERKERATRSFSEGIRRLWSLLHNRPANKPLIDDWLPEANTLREMGTLEEAQTAEGLRKLAGYIMDIASDLELREGKLP